MVAPAAVVWTDGDGQWGELVARMRGELPTLFTLGEYDPTFRTGPAIWLRCIVDRTLPEVWPKEAGVPILYLPRVERQQLRAGGDCPPELQPLVELQYRGTVWHQRNGRDWTVEAFLVAADGCDLDVAKDQATRAALQRILPRLTDVPLDALRGHKLTAEDFDKLAVPDAQRDLLIWMHDPAAFRAGRAASEWKAFCNLVQAGYGFDPEEGGTAEAAQRLLDSTGQWSHLWQRFREAPTRYRGLSALLREPLPGQGILTDRAKLPAVNDDDEANLRAGLAKVTSLAHSEACERVLALEAEHGERRRWVWADLGESPNAAALLPLARLATCASKGLPGLTVEEIVASYAAGGWCSDAAAIDALASSTGPAQQALIASVVRTLYLPWLDQASRQFQEAMARNGGTLPTQPTPPLEPGTCLLFADGLRFDIAAKLLGELEARGIAGRLTPRIGPVPTVTATAKPLATNVADAIVGGEATDFTPHFKDTKQPVVAQKLRDRMAARGVDILVDGEVQAPSSASAVGWMEIGQIDAMGHKLGEALAQQIAYEIDRLRETVLDLLAAGWQQVRVVTDHGWLLMPGGLPKIELPSYLVTSKWGRCATVREGATPSVSMHPWYWNADVRIATPPGAGAYVTGMSYAHGGVSPQECVVPELTFERGTKLASAKITAVEWKRMRCVVTVAGTDSDLRIDIRGNWKLADTSRVLSPKAIGDAGEVSIAVSDEFEGQAAMVVIIDSKDQVLDKRSTTVGGE